MTSDTEEFHEYRAQAIYEIWDDIKTTIYNVIYWGFLGSVTIVLVFAIATGIGWAVLWGTSKILCSTLYTNTEKCDVCAIILLLSVYAIFCFVVLTWAYIEERIFIRSKQISIRKREEHSKLC